MIFSPLISRIKSRLTVKLVLIFVLFFSTVSILLSSFFVIYQKSLLENELRERLHSLARNLAYNCSNNLDPNNKSIVNLLVTGVKREPYIEHVFLTDMEGKILAASDTLQTGKTCPIPSGIDSTSGGKWFPADNQSLRRTITPVEIDVQIVDTKHSLIAPLKGELPFPDNTLQLVSFIFPKFTPKSDAVTCSAFGDSISSMSSISGTSSIMDVSIRNHSLRLLVNGGTNAFWNRDGRFLVYSGYKKPFGVYVVNRETGEEKKIAEDKTGMCPVPCFTPDGRHIIATLLTKEGNQRLFSIPREGGAPVQITFHEGGHWWPECSPDGRWVLYSDISSSKLYAYDTQIKKSMRVFTGLNDEQWGGSFSPDCSQICYLRKLDERCEPEVFIADFPFNGSLRRSIDPYGRQLTSTGRSKWMTTNWSPDGKWITFAEEGLNGNHNIWIVPSQGGEPINLTGSLQSQRKKIGYVILDVSMNTLNLAVEKGRRIAFLISLLLTVIGAFGALFIVRSIVRPVQNLRDAAEEIANGDMNQKIPTNRGDEIGMLTQSFNRMIERLKISREEVDAGTRELVTKHHELEKAYKELDTLDKAKDDFVSLVSHEFRTPMSSISAYTEILLYGWVKSKKKRDEFLTTMLAECKRLTRLVNDVLDLSKIEAGRKSFKLEGLNISAIVNAARDELQPLLEKKGIRFDNTIQNTVIRALGDRDGITQVLTNIISNAAKFNIEGGVILASMNYDNDTCTVSIKDSGKGIKEEDIPKIFDRFAQLETIEHHSEGTGLGMSISKSIIERLGGRIWIESGIGKGSIVSFTLPRSKDEFESDEKSASGMIPAAPMNNNNSRRKYQRKILIVDDEKPLRAALYEFVKNAGFEPIEAENGYEALRLVKEQHPALLILDVMMPDISGLEVSRALKNDPETSGIKIIMLSARGQDKEKEEGIQAGADRYITKPFSYEELGPAIKELLGD
jgi:signal transduction histidine kinase/ActR/RegA family two-component response regulator